MNPKSLIIISPEIAIKSANSRILITSYNPDLKEVLEISGTGLDIWQILRDNISIKEIIDELEEVYGELEEDKRKEVNFFLQKLAEVGFIVIKEPANY